MIEFNKILCKQNEGKFIFVTFPIKSNKHKLILFYYQNDFHILGLKITNDNIPITFINYTKKDINNFGTKKIIKSTDEEINIVKHHVMNTINNMFRNNFNYDLFNFIKEYGKYYNIEHKFTNYFLLYAIKNL